MTQYQIKPTYDTNGTLIDVAWEFLKNYTTNQTYERFDFRSTPLVLFSNSAANSNMGYVAVYNITNGTVVQLQQVNGSVSVNNTVLNQTYVGLRAYLEVFDNTYYKIVYASRSTVNDSYIQVNNRHSYYTNGTWLYKDELNITQLNVTQNTTLTYANSLVLYLDILSQT